MNTITARGYLGGQVTFDGRFVEISKRGIAAFIGGSGTKRIPLHAVSAIQLKPAGRIGNGFIQFTIGGGNELRSKWGEQAYDAAQDENSVVFLHKHEAQFLTLRAAVEAAMQGAPAR